MTTYGSSKGMVKKGVTVRCQRRGSSWRVRPGWQGAQESLQKMKEAAEASASQFRVENFLFTEVPKESRPEGRSEGTCLGDMMEGVQVCG